MRVKKKVWEGGRRNNRSWLHLQSNSIAAARSCFPSDQWSYSGQEDDEILLLNLLFHPVAEDTPGTRILDTTDTTKILHTYAQHRSSKPILFYLFIF